MGMINTQSSNETCSATRLTVMNFQISFLFPMPLMRCAHMGERGVRTVRERALFLNFIMLNI